MYDKPVSSEPEEFPVDYVAAVGGQKEDSVNRQSSSQESYIKVAHYTEMEPILLKVLEEHREGIALPGESLGVTH